MKLIASLVVVTSVFFYAAGSADAKEIKKKQQFMEQIAGKKLTSGNTWIVISADGTLTGVAQNNAKITGAWVWNRKFWCRNVVAGTKTFPEDCLKVAIDGNQVTFTRKKGKGDSIAYTIEN